MVQGHSLRVDVAFVGMAACVKTIIFYTLFEVIVYTLFEVSVYTLFEVIVYTIRFKYLNQRSSILTEI